MKPKLIHAAPICLLGASIVCAQGTGVSLPEAREAAVAKARASLEAAAIPNVDVYRAMKDPFNPPETDLKDLVVDVSARPKETVTNLVSDTDVLQSLAASIRPTGAVQIGGEPYLLFGEKRLKTGDTYTVTKDGVDYTVVIDSIEASRFSIRYNSQVLFRQIK